MSSWLEWLNSHKQAPVSLGTKVTNAKFGEPRLSGYPDQGSKLTSCYTTSKSMISQIRHNSPKIRILWACGRQCTVKSMFRCFSLYRRDIRQLLNGKSKNCIMDETVIFSGSSSKSWLNCVGSYLKFDMSSYKEPKKITHTLT